MSFSLFEKILLFHVKGIGLASLDQILKTASSIDELLNWSDRDWYQLKRVNKDIINEQLPALLKDKVLINQIEKSIETADEVISYWDHSYPPLLKEIALAPPFLFCRGNVSILKQHALAIVGTRFASRYGLEQATQLTQAVVDRGIVTVSGLARGIDTIVHSVSIASTAETIAVIGTGLDICYPRENNRLAETIVDQNGL
ncbi:MAG: DNA-processing protein DprA, partial [Calditrichaeota bacterium]|nr:DNA-processing protein DprA [Calditrichota bacterium]